MKVLKPGGNCFKDIGQYGIIIWYNDAISSLMDDESMDSI